MIRQSTYRLSSFLSKVPEADSQPTAIAPWVMQLGTVAGDWTDKTWVRWLRDSFANPSLLLPGVSTAQHRVAM